MKTKIEKIDGGGRAVVVTTRTPAGFQTEIIGGVLDGEVFRTRRDPARQHSGAVALAVGVEIAESATAA